MSNRGSNLQQPSSWIARVIVRTSAALQRMNPVGGAAKSSRGWTIALVVCALLVGGISLTSIANKRHSKNVATVTAAAASETKVAPVLPKLQAKQSPKGSEAKHPPEVKSTQIERASKEEKELEQRTAAGIRQREEVQLSPGALPEEEGEGADMVRARANWFFDQRAYPNQHIPEGALQQAIQQRDLMKQQRMMKSTGQLSTGIISFPGNALWQLMGPQPVNELFSVNSGFPTASGRATAIAVDTTDATGQTVYIGGAAGGVWKTTDGGAHWTVLTDTQPSLAIGAITIDPNNHNTIYVGTGEENFSGDAFYGAGILKSTDGGTTWAQIGASTFAQVLGPSTGGALVGQIAVQPGNSSIVLAAVSFFVGGTVGGIYRSTDGGTTWTEDAAPRGVAATQVVFESTVNAGTTAIAWAAMGNPFGETANGIYRSADSGLTWTKQASTLPASGAGVGPGRITLGYAPSTAGGTATVYAALADAATSSSDLLGFFSTTNGGTTWTKLTSTPTFCNHQCFYDIAVGVHPTNANFVVVGGGAFTNNSTSLFKTTDGGTTWTTSTAPNDFTLGTTSTRPHVDTHAFAFAANGATPRFYVGNDGGVWRTDDPTVTPPLWVDLNATLAITQFYPGPSAGIGDENSGFGGTQDNDTELFSGNFAWDNVFACGDGGFTAIDPNIPTTIYTTCDSQASHVVRRSVFNGSISTGQTFAIADSGIVRTDRMLFIPPLTIDQNNPNSLYFGSCRVWQTNDGAATWNPISGDLSFGNNPVTSSCPGTGSITSMDVSNQSSSTLLAGTSNGKVWETINGGASWAEIDNALLPNRHVTAVKTKRNDATGQIAYVTFSGFGACGGCGATPGHVFKTINGGAAWTNISGDLPDIPVNDIIVDHQGSPTFDALYIATDVGVFACPDPEATPACANWTVVGDGLPNSPVLGLAMRRSSRILRAFTHGRSAWQIQLTDVNPPAVASLSSVTPGAVRVGAATLPVDIFGLNFSTNTQVFFDGASVGAATFVDTTHLTVSVNSSFFTDGHVFAVTVTDLQGADNSSLPFTVMNPILGTPTLTNPNTNAGVPYTLHFTGSNFVNSTAVALTTFGNFVLPGGVASVNGTVFDVPVPAAFLTTAMPVAGTITNPLPGGGPNPPFNFNFTINPGTIIFNPSPIALSTFLGTTSTVANIAIINTSASSATITAQSITVPGTNPANFSFAAPTSNTCNFPTSGQSGTGTITLAANGGTCNFGLTYFANPVTPGNAVSTATLSVTDNASGSPQTTPIQGTPIPALVVLSGANFGAVTVGTTSPTMNATLSNFTSSSINVTSAFTVSGTNQADFHIVPFVASSSNPGCPTTVPFALGSFLACDVTLTFTPSLPAGSETAQLNVTASVAVTTINPNLAGIGIEITSISPSIVASGGPAFTLTVNGGGFAPSAVVNVNGNVRPTTFVSANQLLASIPATDIATAGSLAISVTTPVPGGTQSEPKTLVVAQAPSATNDNINFATTVSATPFRTTEDTTQATVNTGGVTDPAVSCATNSVARSVWFKFVAPATGRVIADTKFARYLTILSAWTGTPGSLVAVPGACASGNIATTSPAQTFIGFPVTNGTTYFLMATDASSTGPGGTLTFSLDFASAAPANDPFAGATNIAAAPFTNSVNSILATANTGATDPTPSCTVGAPGLSGNGTANSVWYKFTAPANGTITADTLTSPYNTILTAVTGAPGSFTEVACNDNVAITVPVLTVLAQSQVSFAASNGTTYFFMASSFFGDGGTTTFHLTFSATTAPGVAFNPTNIPFGNQKVATTSATTNVQLTNSGSATLNVTGITKTGTDPTQFAIVAPTSGTACSPLTGPFSLNAGISCNFGVQFAPTTTGAKSANISVADNATGSPQTVPLTGTGAVPVASLAPANIAFPSQTISTSSATSDVTLTNTGLASMNITSITLTGTDPTQFTLGAPTSGTACPLGASALAAGANCKVGVIFAPTTLGAKSANVSVADDAAGSPQTVPLTGTGVSAPAPVATFSAASIPFGNQKVGTTSGALNATLTNTGNANLNITAVSITGTNAADFTSSGTTCTGTTVLTPTQACTLGATFTPGAQGARAAAFTITDNAAGSPHSLPLTGTGTIPGVGLAPANIAFGNLLINTTSATNDVTLTNSGLASLSITSITLTGTDPTQFTLGAPTSGTACPLGASALAAGANCKVGVKFAPTTTGAKSASVSFTDDATGSPQTVPLTGTGTAPGITLAPVNIAFGNQRTGTSSATTNVTITNSGTATLSITSITLTGANPTQFTLGAPTSGTACVLGVNAITAGSNCSVGVKFSPTNTGAQTANVSVADDAAGSPQTVPLTGTGTAPAVTFAPTNIAFGNQRTGTSSATTNVMITNSGTATLNITSITLTGANPTQFTLGAPTSGTACVLGVNAITAGSNCSVGVKFSPTNTGAQTANVSVADDATGSPQTVPLTGTGTVPVASLAPANIPFGNQNTGTSSATTDVTLTNTGLASMSITSITLTGTDITQFSLGAPTTGTACPLGASVLAAGANCKVGVKFAPTTTGAKSASVSFADDAAGSPQTVPLTGTGITGTIGFSPSPVNFGNQRTGTTSAATTVTVTNSGGAAVHLAATAVSFGGTNPGDFAAAAGTTCANNLTLNPSPGPGNTCVVNVTFAPGATGARAGTLLLADDATGSPQSANLTGTGTAPAVTFAPANVPFGNQKVGTTSATTDVMITNSGTATLNITSITLTGTDPAQFTLGAPTSGTACPLGASALNAGANCKVGVQFAPTSAGAKGANVSVADDATASPQTVPLTGTGAVPAVTLAPANVPFGNQKVGTTSAKTDVTITNSGLAQLNITGITLTGVDAGQYAIGAPTSGTACPLGASNLAAGANCKVGVAFAPTSAGLKNANVSVADDAAASPQTVPLTGTGTIPGVTFAPVNVPFGNQRVGTTSAKTDVTITNSGLAQLNITSITLTGADAGQYTLGAPTAGTACPLGASNLAAGANCKVGVAFAPTSTGLKNANVNVADDAAASPQTVPLTGTGAVPAAGLVPANIAFGNQTINTSSLTTDVTLSNTGLAQLNLASITLTGTDPTQFTLGAPTSGTACPLGVSNLAAGANCKVGVKFSPTTAGAKSANVSFADDAAGSPQTVPLTGTGVTATVTLSPPLAFGNQRTGTSSAAMTVTLTNTSNVAVHLAVANSITFIGANAADFTATAPASGTPCSNGATVAASGGACTIGVAFSPTTVGAEAATLNVADDAPGSPQTDNLTGTGIFPQATPLPNPVNFNNQVLNTTSGTMAVTLTNGGTDVLHLAAANAVVIGGTNASDFAIAAGTTCTNSASVNAGANCVINLTFTPSALSARTATVTITDDANPANQVVTLNGSGTNPAPTITTLAPNSTTALGPAFPLTINGTNFVAGATVNFGANPALTPTTITAGQILVTVPAADITAGGAINVTVTNPAPGGGTSAAAIFTINNPVPTITTLSPTSATAGGAAFVLTVNGTGFVTAQSVIKFNGNAKTTTVVSATQATAPIAAADIAAAGTFPVTVTNAAPGGGTTAPTNFTVNNPVPTLTSIAPTSGVLGQSVNLTLTGTNFVAGSIVNFGANADAGGVVSNGGNTLTITIPAAQLNAAGPVNVTVTNPAPGGGTTAAQVFTVNNPVPTLTSVAPTSGVLGQAANLTLTGTGFNAGSIVNFGANADAGGVVSNGGNTLTITIPAAQLNAAGPVNITVKNPAPGGGTSAAVVFTVNNPQPVITPPLSPASANAGGAAFTLTINGSNFIAGAKVDFGADKGLTPTSVTAAQIKVNVPAADIATGGTPNVVVNNPAPAVGPSAPSPFTVNNPVPTVTSAKVNGNTHASGGVALNMTISGTNFVTGSTVNFGTNPAITPPPGSVTATQITVTIPANDVSSAGNVNVTVTNPAPAGGTTAPTVFTVDGYTVSGPANTPVKAGQMANIVITITGTNPAGFANPVTFAVSGLPAHSSAVFSPASVPAFTTAATTTTLTITTIARGEAPPSAPLDPPVPPLLRLLPVMWLAAMLAGLAAMRLVRRMPQRRRYATVLSLAMVLLTGAVLAGCAGGKAGTPAGAAQLTVTATSGTMAVSNSSITLTVQ